MLSSVEITLLRDIAWASIDEGFAHGCPATVHLDTVPPALQQHRACFVTLEKHGELRGCIGHLEAVQPLAQDAAENAFQAAFRDPRFPPLHPKEKTGLDLHISILTVPEPLPITSEADLLAKLQPGRDGIILAEGPRRATFLPSVWEQLPDPKQFLRHLKAKAGWSPDYWSDRIMVQRYCSENC